MPRRGRYGKHVCIVVQNLPVPFDRRVWLEATTLAKAECRVSVICPSFFRTNLCDNALGSDRVRKMALHLMDTSPDSIDSVADAVFTQVADGRFMVLPTRREPMRWRLKRWFPALYRQLLQRQNHWMRSRVRLVKEIIE